MQNWFALSDPAMEEALYEIASLRTFARLSLNEALPDETTILNFRHLLEENDLAEDIFKAVNAHLARKGLLLKRGSIVSHGRASWIRYIVAFRSIAMLMNAYRSLPAATRIDATTHRNVK